MRFGFLCTALALVASLIPAQPYDLAVPYGIHGPSHSHMRNSPDVWEHSQVIYDTFHELGVEYARMDAWWTVVEPEPGRWEFDHFDRSVASYAENGIKPMFILCYGAKWENAAGPTTDETREAFGEYVYQMVNRYQDTVKEWEIWNEPNILPFWAPEPSAADYAALLQVAYRRAKEADPDCVVIAGALAGPDSDFLRGIFEHGAGDSFDVLSYHNYGNRIDRAGTRREIAGLREVMESNGRGDTPIWLSEHGIFTGPGGVTEREQARGIVRLAVWRWANGIERMMYLSLRDWHADPDSPQGQDFWGFQHRDGTPKESFAALQTMLSVLANRPYRGELFLDPNVEAFYFGQPGDNAVVMWSKGTSAEIILDAGVLSMETRSLLGESQWHLADMGQYALTLTEDPLWLINVGDNLALQAAMETEAITGARGERVPMSLTLRNPLSGEITLHVNPQNLLGIQMALDQREFTLPPGGEVNATISVEILDTAETGTLHPRIFIEENLTQSTMSEIAHCASITVEPPFTVKALPMYFFETNRTPILAIPYRIERHTAEPISASYHLDGVPAASHDLVMEDTEAISGVGASQFPQGERHTHTAIFTGAGHTETITTPLRIYRVPHLDHEVTLDGDLSEWRDLPPTMTPDQFTEIDFNPTLNKGTDDMAITAWLAWSDAGLHMALEVVDDVLTPSTAHMVWDYDSLQIALDPLHDGAPLEGFNYDDMEIEIGLRTDGGVELFPGRYPPGRIEDIVAEESQVVIVSDESTLRYEMFFPAPVLDPMPFEAGAVVGFNFICNDNDGQGREGWFELAPGIGWGKVPYEYPALLLLP